MKKETYSYVIGACSVDLVKLERYRHFACYELWIRISSLQPFVLRVHDHNSSGSLHGDVAPLSHIAVAFRTRAYSCSNVLSSRLRLSSGAFPFPLV